jgi:hypothetical protein
MLMLRILQRAIISVALVDFACPLPSKHEVTTQSQAPSDIRVLKYFFPLTSWSTPSFSAVNPRCHARLGGNREERVAQDEEKTRSIIDHP